LVTSATADFRPAESNRNFSIMSSSYVAEVVLKPLMSRLRKDAPGIHVEVKRLSGNPSEAINQATVDLLVAPKDVLCQNFPSERLLDDRIVCVVWSANQLVGEEISIEQLMEMEHVCMFKDTHSSGFLKQFGPLKVMAVLAEPSSIPPVIEDTNLIATMPLRYAQHCTKNYSLRIVNPSIEFPLFVEFIQWNPHQECDPGLIWFRSCIKEAVASS
jgi:DNA-binding transcriptional LysR family regulator